MELSDLDIFDVINLRYSVYTALDENRRYLKEATGRDEVMMYQVQIDKLELLSTKMRKIYRTMSQR